MKAKVFLSVDPKDNPNKVYIAVVSLLCWLGLLYSAALAQTTIVIIAAACLLMIGFVVPVYQKGAASLLGVETESRVLRYCMTVLGTVLLEAAGLLLALAVWFPLGLRQFLLPG